MEEILPINKVEYRRELFDSEERFHFGIMKEFNVSEQYVRDGIKIIMDWYRSTAYFPKYALDFDFIEGMFSNCKFSVEKTKQKLDCYLSVRNAFPEYFRERDPLCADAINGHRFTSCTLMPKLTPDGCRIIYIGFPCAETKDYSPENGYKTLFMCTDVRLFFDQCTSDIFVFDFGTINFGHICKFTPTVARNSSFIFQNAYCHRIKALHITNLSKMAVNSAKLMTSFLTKKLSQRVFFHENSESLFKHVPAEYLPSDIGGTCESSKVINEKYFKIIHTKEWRDWYRNSGKELVKEDLRPTKNEKLNEFMGVCGTFRKLDLD